jgi:16S rRNA (guanine1207-N2)-methyltransferase
MLPPPGLALALVGICGHLRTHHHFLDCHRKDLRAGLDSSWGVRPLKSPGPDTVVLVMPRSKDRARWLLASAADALEAGGRMILVGRKRSGVLSMREELRRYVGPVEEDVRARGCVALVCRREGGSAPPPGELRFSVNAAVEMEAVSLPGVFSHGRLDDGTRLLLAELEGARFRRGLDWGCGSGVLGAFLAMSAPESHVDLCDIDAMAVEASRRTLAAGAICNARVHGSVGISDLDGRWDLVAANPPFHRGGVTDLGPAESLIGDARRRLAPGGRLMLVANAFLPYERRLAAAFAEVSALREEGGFKVLEARGPLRN